MATKLILPKFSNRRFREATFCGSIPISEFPEKAKLQETKEQLIADFAVEGREYVLSFVPPYPGYWDEKLHVHFEIAARDMFKKLPKANSTVEEIQNRVEPLFGKHVNVNEKGVFRMTVPDLPPYIRATLAETAAANVQVRMTGATLTVRGVPIEKISWKIVESSGDVDVTLEARTDKPLSESYLSDGIELFEEAFTAFIFAEK